MNIIVIQGSPHPHGGTSSLLKAFISGSTDTCSECSGHTGVGIETLQSSNSDIEYFSAYDMEILPCADCGLCENADICQHADLDRFDSSIRRCDGIIIASPVYHATFPAPLKALFDRTQRYYYAYKNKRPLFSGASRPVAVLLTAGQAKETGEVIKNQLRWILPALNSHISEFFAISGTNLHSVDASATSQAEKAGKRFFSQFCSLSDQNDV